MKTLIIDTTSSRLYCLLTDGTTLLADSTQIGIQHSTLLNCSIDNLLVSQNITLDNIDCFAVCVGTGSFTGIRIGIAAIKGFLTVFPNKKLVTVTSLNVLAYTKTGAQDCIMDAGRELYYYARYNGTEELISPMLISSTEGEKLKETNALVWDSQADYTKQLCSLVADKIEEGQFSDSPHPLYLRQPQAVEELNKRKGI